MRATINQTVYRTLLIYSPTTGGLVAPDGTPTCSVIRNGTVDVSVSVTVSSVSTGRYSLSFTVPSGYAVDDVIELVATWAVSSVPGAMLWTMQVDATVSSRMATFSYTAPDNATITAINAKTTNLPSDPADASDIATAFVVVNSTLASLPSAATIAAAVWGAGSRTLSSFGTLATDLATAVWGATTRTLSSFGTLVSDVVSGVAASTPPSGFFTNSPAGSGGGGGGLTPEQEEILQRTAAAVGAYDGTESQSGATITQVLDRPDGGTLTKVSSVSGNNRNLSTTTTPGE